MVCSLSSIFIALCGRYIKPSLPEAKGHSRRVWMRCNRPWRNIFKRWVWQYAILYPNLIENTPEDFHLHGVCGFTDTSRITLFVAFSCQRFLVFKCWNLDFYKEIFTTRSFIFIEMNVWHSSSHRDKSVLPPVVDTSLQSSGSARRPGPLKLSARGT